MALSPFVRRTANRVGKRKGISPALLKGLIEVESGGRPSAVSSAGAQGLTQFIPSTAASYGVKYGTSKKAQRSQIRGAAEYLKDLGVNQNKRLALAGYNAGPGNPAAAGNYPELVMAAAKQYRGQGGGPLPSGGSQGRSKGRTVVTKGPNTVKALEILRKPYKTPEDFQKLGYALKTKTKHIGSSKVERDHAKATGTGNAVPREIVALGHAAQQMGLHVGEHPKFGGVAPVHTQNSYHYSNRALDISGSPEMLRKFAHRLAKKYGKNLAELFWQGPGGINIKNGKRVPQGFVDGHTTHVHVAI